MKIGFMKSLVLLLVIITAFSCTKKKPDPTPVVIPQPVSNPGTNPVPGDTSQNKASFSDGSTTTNAGVIIAQKTASSGHISITMIRVAGGFPSVTLQIASPAGPGVYTDNASTNTYAQINYPDNEKYQTDLQNGGTCSITVTSLTEDHIKGTFDFTGSRDGASKKVTGSFDCNYITK